MEKETDMETVMEMDMETETEMNMKRKWTWKRKSKLYLIQRNSPYNAVRIVAISGSGLAD
jgi:hypothetical protein